MFDIGLQELLVILVIALLVFGPQKLPELGRMLGRALREFRKASDEFRTTVETNLHLDQPDVVSEPGTVPESTPSVTAGPKPDDASLLACVGAAGVETIAVDPPTLSSEPFCAKRGARLVHRRDCRWATRIPEAERLGFDRLSEARAQALVDCPVCEPVEVQS